MIRVFVGCAANGEDIESQIVLESTLRERCSEEVEIIWMKLSRDINSPFAGWRTDLWSTPFSGFRWAVPELCGFEGRGIYVDSDILVRDDIAKLWNEQFEPGKIVIAKGGDHGWRFCVCLWDCAAAKDILPRIEQIRTQPGSHRYLIDFFKTRKHFVQSFSTGNWNCIDGENYLSLNDPEIKIIHYSSEPHQPHLRHAVPRLAKENKKHWFDGEIKRHWLPPLEELFDRELENALRKGYRLEDYQPVVPYGEYIKKSEKNQRPHQWVK
jgi:hypothetical protein